MDHPRPCGPAALAALVIAVFGVLPAATAAPPASGVGDATITPREVASPAETPMSSTAGGNDLDPAELANRIAARLAANDASRLERRADDAPESGPVAASMPSASVAGAAETTGTTKTAAILPAPRPSGSRVTERFDRAADEGAGAVGQDVGGLAEFDGWWSSPEIRVGGLLAAFIGLAVVARRWSNVRGPRAGRPSGVLSVLARYPFGRGASLVLLEVGPRLVLVHQQGGRGGEVRPIAEFTSLEEIADLRTRLGIARRESEPEFGRDLERHLGLYDRKGRPQGFGGRDGLPLDDVMETVDLTRRRPRRGNRAN